MLHRRLKFRWVLLVAFLLSYVIFPSPGLAVEPRRMGYGLNIADLSHTNRIKALGFDWMKGFIRWSSVQYSRGGAYIWGDFDNLIAASQTNGLKLLVRVDGAPSWSHPSNDSSTAPPDSAYLSDWGTFFYNLASHGKGKVQAYEIWNEPNLRWEWGDRSPDPAYYARMLRAAYSNIKLADPTAIVVSSGLATTGGDGNVNAMDDVEFIRQMYAAPESVKGYFDVLGSHPYGFASAPEDLNENGILQFRRAEAQHDMMVQNGDGAKKVWATEFGWLVDPNSDGNGGCTSDWRWDGRTWQIVSPETQADYLVRAFNYAYGRWPWMEVMIVFNLDFSSVPWYDACEPMRYYSIMNGNSPRPAYNSLLAMVKSGLMTFGHFVNVPLVRRGNAGGW